MKKFKNSVVVVLALGMFWVGEFSCASTVGTNNANVQPLTESNIKPENSNAQKVSLSVPSNSKFDKEEFILEIKKTAKEQGAKKALAGYSKVPKKSENDYDLLLLKTKLEDVAGMYPEALSTVKIILAKNPKDEEALKLSKSIVKKQFMTELQTCLDKDDFEGIKKLYAESPAELKEDFNLNLIKASIWLNFDQIAEAEKICNQLEEKSPGNVEVQEIRLAIAERKGDGRARMAALNAIIAKDEFNVQANVSLAQNAVTKAQSSAGKVKNDFYKKARTYYQKALAKEPDNQDALFGFGQMDYYLENDNRAKTTFTKMVTADPQNAEAWLYLGKIAAANSEFKVASDYVKKAVDIDPDNYSYNLDYGMYESHLGHFENAEKSWTKAIEIQPEYFLGYAYRAGLYDEYGKYDQSIKDYKMVVKLNPQYYFAYESIGILAFHQKQWTQARQAFMKSYEFQKSMVNDKVKLNISYPLMVTYCYLMEGKVQEAKQFSESVYRKMENTSLDYLMLRVYHDQAGDKPLPQRISTVTNTNERAKMYFYLALLYEKYGAHEAAKEFYTKVLSINSPMIFEYRLAEWAVEALKNIEE